MIETGTEKQRKIGICERCGKATVVWVASDGAVRPVSEHNGCSCSDSSFRTINDAPHRDQS